MTRPVLPWYVTTLALVVLILVTICGACLVLTPDGWSVNRLNVRIWYAVLSPVGLHTRVSPEQFAVLANVLLFIPVFWALSVLWPRRRWIAVGAGLSLAIELYHSGITTRLSELSDLLANTAGTAIGVVAGLVTHRVLARRARAEASAHE